MVYIGRSHTNSKPEILKTGNLEKCRVLLFENGRHIN
jgi:hypothetical protein